MAFWRHIRLPSQADPRLFRQFQGEVHHSPGPEGPVPPPAATEKPGRSGRGKDSEGARLDDKSDCSIDEAPSTYAKWPIFVCQVATFAGVAEGQSTGPLQEDGGRARPRDSESPAGTEGGSPDRTMDYRI
jgi:hypothetical protein